MRGCKIDRPGLVCWRLAWACLLETGLGLFVGVMDAVLQNRPARACLLETGPGLFVGDWPGLVCWRLAWALFVGVMACGAAEATGPGLFVGVTGCGVAWALFVFSQNSLFWAFFVS